MTMQKERNFFDRILLETGLHCVGNAMPTFGGFQKWWLDQYRCRQQFSRGFWTLYGSK